MNGESPPTMIAVVVLYAATFEVTPIAWESRTREGLMSAELYGPRKAI